MKFAIRADASVVIGTGHVIRCLTLADALRARGCGILFVCRAHQGHLAARIDADGFPLALLPAAAVDQAGDAQQTLAALADAEFSPDWIVVDHYGLGEEWERAVRVAASRVMVIDDLADRMHDCDVLLDQNLVTGYEHRYDGLTPKSTMHLLGPQFALLQPQYRRLHKAARQRSGVVSRILVFFGGADLTEQTELALNALIKLACADIAIDVVLGPSNPRREAIATLAQGVANVAIHEMVPSLADLMAQADLAVGASGTASWERLCLGLPAIVVTLADNQRRIAEELDRIGCVRWLGDADHVGVDAMVLALRDSLGTRGTDWFNAEVAATVDGLGVRRVVDALLAKQPEGLVLRVATVEDVDLYFRWANEPEVRRQSFNPAEISHEHHVAWFNAKLASPDCRLYVLCDGRTPLGEIRFDIAEGTGQIGYSLDAAARGRGLAKVLLGLGIDRMASEDVHSFSAKVKHGNQPSAAAFIRCGFTEGSADGYRIFHRPAKWQNHAVGVQKLRSVG